MSNTIDRLEELEGRATPAPWEADANWHIKKAGMPGVYETHGSRPSPNVILQVHGPKCAQTDCEPSGDYDLILALRNAAKPLLAVVRAAELYEQATTSFMQAVGAEGGVERTDDEIEAESHKADAAREALRLALATLKETTL
jgi:hypothetical protein